VRCLSTGGGAVRLGPNLYADGKVCLSILGTWAGPSWLPTFSLTTVLVCVHALLTARPAALEPGHEDAPPGEVAALNDAIEHEVLRAVVLGQLGGDAGTGAPDVRAAIRETFAAHAEALAARARERAPVLDGALFADPAYARVRAGEPAQPRFQFALLAAQIDAAAEALASEDAEMDGGAGGSGDGGGGGGGGGSAAAAAQ
jgi:hypothetical protein